MKEYFLVFFENKFGGGKMQSEITIHGGSCAAESSVQVMYQTQLISMPLNIAAKYGINFKFRAGAYKPRTKLRSNGEQTFEGHGAEAMSWLGEASGTHNVRIVTELMDAADLPEFFKHLDPYRDMIQVGARSNQNYSLLAYAGLTPFSIIVKSPMGVIDADEAQGSLERITHPTKHPEIVEKYKRITGEYSDMSQNPNKAIVYCVRGEKKPKGKGVRETRARQLMLDEMHMDQVLQDPDSRNFNNMEDISVLRKNPYFAEHRIQFFFDPSHVMGGKNNRVRRKIGTTGLQAILDPQFNYDGLSIEVHDWSAGAITDKDQALVTTYNGIDWTQTNMASEPPENEKPLTLADIIKELIVKRVKAGVVNVRQAQVASDLKALDDLRWIPLPRQ